MPTAVGLCSMDAFHRLQPPALACPHMQIAYHNSKLEEVSQHSVRISKQATIGDLLEEVRQTEGGGAGQRRIFRGQVLPCVC